MLHTPERGVTPSCRTAPYWLLFSLTNFSFFMEVSEKGTKHGRGRASRCRSAEDQVERVPVKMTSLSGEMSTAEVKSQKKRKRRKIELGNTSDSDVEWAKSLSECQLDLMVSVKQLALERVRSTREKSLNGLLTPAGLRAIGIILEEFMIDRVQTLRNASTAPSSVIDDLRACIEKSEVETKETKETNQDKLVIETDEGS